MVITGASSGIGRACALHMIQAGWHVFATVRKIEDKERLQSDDLTPVIMDVQDRSTIFAAAEQITSQLAGRGLDGLVNVAGRGMVRPVEYASNDDLQEIFDINVFGHIAVTQAFLPLIRKSRGRIVNITSVGAHIAIPFGGLLNASKSAFGLLSDWRNLRESHMREKWTAAPQTWLQKLSITRSLRGDRGFGTRWENMQKLLGTLPRILSEWLLDAIRLRITGLPSGFGAAEPIRHGKRGMARQAAPKSI